MMCVSLSQGIIERPIVLNFETTDGSAQGMLAHSLYYVFFETCIEKHVFHM